MTNPEPASILLSNIKAPQRLNARGTTQEGTLCTADLTKFSLAGFDPLRDDRYLQTALAPTITDFLAWFELGGKAPITVANYRRYLARGAMLYPKLTLAQLGDAELLQIMRAFPPSSRPPAAAAWRRLFKWAVKSRLVERNPCEALPDFQRKKQRVYDIFSEAEIDVLCDLPLRDGALMQLLFDAGLRKGECRRFRLTHLRAGVERVEVMILGSKGQGGNSKDRVVPATAAVAQRVTELGLLDGLERNDYLWYGITRTPHFERLERGKPIGEGTFHRWWARCLDHACVRYRNPHMTRHTFATRYLRGGGSLERLSMAMGHTSIKTTWDDYSHLDTNDLANEFERVFPNKMHDPKSIRSSLDETPANEGVKAPSGFEPLFQSAEPKADR